MQEGLYKCVYSVAGAVGRSIMYVHAGQMLGGNSAFAHFGTYVVRDGETIVEIETRRHNADPTFKAMLGQDVGSINVAGRLIDGRYRFEGTTPQIPGAVFRSEMTTIEGEAAPPTRAARDGDIANGLYSIHIRTLDGVDGGLNGVMLLHDGRILGGDAFFYYLGTYTSANGRWKGEMINQEHTPAKGEVPVFGGHEVGIGFTGTYGAAGAAWQATALAGKLSLRLTATLALIRKA